jgi:hypothetical protein
MPRETQDPVSTKSFALPQIFAEQTTSQTGVRVHLLAEMAQVMCEEDTWIKG